MNATQAVEALHDPPVPAKATEDQMLRYLWRHFADRWSPIPQVTVAPGDLEPSAQILLAFDGPEPASDGNDRRIDMLLGRRAQDRAKAGLHETLAIEVKVTRADFLSDVRNPAKQAAWKKAATRHTYAVPAGLVQPSEVPPECGLIWVTPPNGLDVWFADVKWVKKAPYTPGHRPQLPLRVLNTLLYRLAAYEGRTRGWVHTGQPATMGSPEEVRASLIAAHKAVADLERKLETAEGRANAWKAAYAIAASAGLPCAICGRPLRPLRPTKNWFSSWRHVDAGDDEPCSLSDVAMAEAEARASYEAATTEEREARLRGVHRLRLDEAVNAEPWRGWLRHAPADPSPRIDYTPETT